MRSWVIGNRADCDVVVDSSLASGRHCQLTQTLDGFLLDDLGATNGTYVDGVRITSPTRVVPGETITLGQTLPMPWPSELVRFVTIGRLPDNEIVFDDPRVSGHHARLIVIEGFETRIQDLGSSNGTFLNSADRRVTIPTCVSSSDTLYFGTLDVPAARLLAEIKKPETQAKQPPPVTAAVQLIQAPAPAQPATNVWEEYAGPLAWLGQVPVLALFIIVIFGRLAAVPTTAANWAAVGQGIAATSFALALAAIWLGCSLAVEELAAGRSPVTRTEVDPASFATSFSLRLAVRGAYCAAGCALLLAIVYWGSGLQGPWPAMWAVLLMTSLTGLLIGMTVSAFVPNTAVVPSWAAAAGVLLIGFVLMAVLGGWLWPLPTITSQPVRLAAAGMPTRWAFEGLISLETANHSPPAPGESSDQQVHDPAEAFFPSTSERMGARADAMALASMVIGLAALAAFVVWNSRPSR